VLTQIAYSVLENFLGSELPRNEDKDNDKDLKIGRAGLSPLVALQSQTVT